ncbi:MAG TPA: TIGR03435 family protein [Acidobacteriaceae bacterium]|nr:TIGR03435 family protein [Acidobacteriaceae bacterium]
MRVIQSLMMALVVCAQQVTYAQAAMRPLAFEVASVRQAVPPQAGAQTSGGLRTTGAGQMRQTPDRISYEGVTLRAMLQKAYGLMPSQISGPGWIDDQHYDVVATIPDGTTKEQVPMMLQNLLLDRFRISLHTEMKEEPVYVLAVAKGGPKLNAAADGERESIGMNLPDHETGSEKLFYTAQTMAQFAGNLSRSLERNVTDATGLTGKFDFTMQVESQAGSFAPLPSSLFTAVHDLGLELKPGKAPLKHLIIDKAQRVPTEN